MAATRGQADDSWPPLMDASAVAKIQFEAVPRGHPFAATVIYVMQPHSVD